MSEKIVRAGGWLLTIALGGLLAMSAWMKLTQSEIALEQAASVGIDAGTYRVIGVIELFSLILFIIPRTGVVGALLLIAYMGGAIVTHLQHQQSIAMAVGVQILLWITAALRFPELRQRLFSGVPTQ